MKQTFHAAPSARIIISPFSFACCLKPKRPERGALGGASRRSFCAFIYLSTSEQLNDFDFRRATAAVAAALFCSFRAIYLPAAVEERERRRAPGKLLRRCAAQRMAKEKRENIANYYLLAVCLFCKWCETYYLVYTITQPHAAPASFFSHARLFQTTLSIYCLEIWEKR